ncbi:SpoIIE family protein phosphatase [Streptantibioticus rubrisoli]|uniref:SpoIIE family protein phosphatase n=1 Tax=Streptantibioticus rubrisoli TaxID=1387313 RepID=A0ABT1P9K0_9ACTN|nr:SpoIIE family protein phosphatase [Streptantibioticus rubrisoli]MCQ4042054.1 SpoIIE family protein phosphatase [Streptantibioticus rubrisoli]
MCPDASGRDDADALHADALFDAAAAALAAHSTDQVLRGVLNGTSAGIVILDPRLRHLYANPAFTRMTGVPAADLLGRTLAEALPEVADRPDVQRQVLDDGQPREVVISGRTHADAPEDRRWWHCAYHRLTAEGGRVGLVGIMLEITEFRQQQHDLEQARHRLSLLDTAATRIGTTLDVDMTCAELADFIVPRLADLATVEVVPSDAPHGTATRPGALRLRRTALATIPTLTARAHAVGVTGEYVRHPAGSAVQRCVANGSPVLWRPGDDERPEAEHVAEYRAMGVHSLLVVPLTARGHTIGAMTLARAGLTPPFGEEDTVLAQDLAGRAAISVDNASRYARSQGIALELQRALLAEPGSPHPNLEMASRYLPSGTSAVVGGDWYETIRLPYGRTLLAMGDVMGHGIEAAVDMSNYRSILRYVAATDLPPHRILRQLDTLICEESEASRPATCLLALTDPARERCAYASAGHLPPALLGEDGGTELINVPGGPPLGTCFGGYELVTSPFRPGQVLLLYTDGLVERRGEDIDVSLARLADLKLPVAGDLDDLLDEVLRGLVPQAAEDDIAVLAARLRPRPGPDVVEPT